MGASSASRRGRRVRLFGSLRYPLRLRLKVKVTMPVSVTFLGNVAVRRNGLRHLNRLTISPRVKILPNAHGNHADVKIREPHPDHAHPRPEHVPLVKPRHPLPGLVPQMFLPRRAGKTIEPPAYQMPPSVTAQGVPREKDHVDGHHQRADADTELSVPETGRGRVIGENNNIKDRDVQRVPVQVLE